MKISDEDKKQILLGFIKIFTRIYDKEYQQRVWIDGRGPECDDFDDTVCDFFGVGDSIIENYKDFGITDQQKHLLMRFRDEFKTFSDEHDWPQDFIDTPKWTKITEMAKEVLGAFHWEKKSPKN